LLNSGWLSLQTMHGLAVAADANRIAAAERAGAEAATLRGSLEEARGWAVKAEEETDRLRKVYINVASCVTLALDIHLPF
jgi:hypothetical protein